ncbi:MAG: peptidoglycan-binding protein [Actinobacteria bacterium]|nr:peptidoglycan-binding protein [Actinomycetota bacterium]
MKSFQFKLPVAPAEPFRVDQIRAYQVLLSSLGFGVPATGTWGPETNAALRAYQAASRLPVTGVIDAATRHFLLRPVAPPLK